MTDTDACVRHRRVHEHGEAGTVIKALGILTARRPAALTRCLESYCANAAAHGRHIDCVIVDGSSLQHDRHASHEALSRTTSRYGVAAQYVGSTEKRELVKALARTRAIPSDVLEFAFFDPERTGASTHGANRNMLMWYTHGEPVLFVDDDTVCTTHRPTGHRELPRVVSDSPAAGVDPAEVWPLGAARDVTGVCQAEPFDYIGEHDAWLGGPVLHASTEHGRSSDRSDRVVLTTNGSVGDCGWGTPSNYLFLRGPSLERLTRSDETYEAASTSHRIMRAVRQPTVWPACEDFISMFFGLDNREMTPPFLPVCRGADRVFAAVLRRCCLGAWFAHLPQVLAHEPERPRRFWRGEITRSAGGIDLTTLLCAMLEALPEPSGISTGERLRSLGEALEDAASESAAFATFATAQVLQRLAARIDQLEAVLSRSPSDMPRGFVRDACAYVTSLRRTSTRADVYIPLDLRIGRDPDEARRLTERVVEQYGRLLQYWPDLLAGRAAVSGVDARHAHP
jgi:hypothetical protein